MRYMKKWLAAVLALVMVFAMAACAVAEETYTITINNTEAGHTYQAYQIFAGDLSTDAKGNKVLSNIEWGTGVTYTGEGVTVGESKSTAAADIADALAANTLSLDDLIDGLTLNTFAKEVASTAGSTSITDLAAGYYLVKDKDSSLDGHYAYTSFILQVVGNVTVSPKSVKPTVDKQVHDETTDAEAGATDGWGESADHAINESFQFKLIAKLPADLNNYDAYEKYKVVFTDTMSDGVTFESIASVTVDGQTVENYTATATTGKAGGSWTLTIDDIKSIEGVTLNDGADIVVIYNAHLNENAQVNHASGTTTNKNTVGLQYSNNPNAGGEGSMGKTPEDTVWVFTYEVDNTKYSGEIAEGKELAGAGFKLYDSTGKTEIGLIYDDTMSAYRPVKGEEAGVEMTSAETTGKFNIMGLDAGTYVLKETTVPAGYNKCDDITVTISATHAEAADGASATTTLSSDSNVTNKIVNKQGSTLPETGGMGTTVLYVGGGVLVLAAVVLLIAKRRSNA